MCENKRKNELMDEIRMQKMQKSTETRKHDIYGQNIKDNKNDGMTKEWWNTEIKSKQT